MTLKVKKNKQKRNSSHADRKKWREGLRQREALQKMTV